MNLKRALKQKNLLVNKLNELYTLIRENNSYPEGNVVRFNVKSLMDESDKVLSELVELKHAIQKANAPVYDKIFRLSELKRKVEIYKAISTTEGVTPNRYVEPIKYVAQLNSVEIKNKIEEIKNEINELQDYLDVYNVNTEI